MRQCGIIVMYKYMKRTLPVVQLPVCSTRYEVGSCQLIAEGRILHNVYGVGIFTIMEHGAPSPLVRS